MIEIGTRGSPLALVQAGAVRDALLAQGGGPVAIVPIRTTGDRIRDRALAEAGGKGLFTLELDAALLAGTVALSVHSAKDLPAILPDGIVIAGYLPREDPRDALIAPRFGALGTLPQGATVGTASIRREAQLKRLRPDLRTTLLRGNVETRLAKLAGGACDATLLALAGLNRLGLAAEATEILDTARMLPAPGQGAVAITCRADDRETQARLAPILDRATGEALAAERAFLLRLDGSCRTPIAGLATLENGTLSFRGLALRPDGTDAVEVARSGAAADAARIGDDAAAELLACLSPGILAAR